MEYEIGDKFLTVGTNPRLGETEKLKSCGASLYLGREKKISVFLCPLEVNFVKNFIVQFNVISLDVSKLLNYCIMRDRHNNAIIRECNHLRDNPDILTPIDALGDFAEGMRHVQKVSLYASLNIDRFGLFLDRGIGKTKVIIDNLTLRILDGEVKKVLIVCPRLNIFNTWLPELVKHSKIKNLPITPIVGLKKDKLKLLQKEDRDLYIHIMTYDAMRDYQSKLGSYDVLIFDESKALGGDSRRSEVAFQLSAKAKYVIMATGTANTLKSMTDVFYQYKTLNLGATFGLKYQDFQDNYFIDVGKHYPLWVLKKGSFEAIKARMFTTAISYKKSECLDLPPRTIEDVCIFPNKFQQLFTDAFADGLNILIPCLELKEFFEKNEINYIKEAQAINDAVPISKISKLQEITSGFYKTYTNSKIIVPFKSAKLDALLETLETIGQEKVIIWCSFIYDINRIQRVLKKKKIKSCVVHGTKDEVQKWQNSKSTTVLIGMESVGKGLTLNEAAYMLYYSYNYSLEHFNQSIDRNYRSGQTRNTTVYILQCIDTIDQAIKKRLASNDVFSNKLTNYKFKKLARGK